MEHLCFVLIWGILRKWKVEILELIADKFALLLQFQGYELAAFCCSAQITQRSEKPLKVNIAVC